MIDESLADLRAQDLAAKQALESLQAGPASPIWDKGLVVTLSMSILVFGIAVILIMAYLISKNTRASYVLRAFGVPLIIVAAIFLVVTGYSQEQIAPVIGLLGTIAGYLLGSKTSESESRDRVDSGQARGAAAQSGGQTPATPPGTP